MSRIPPLRACLVLLAAATACDRTRLPERATLAEVVAWQRTFDLEENDAVINVAPAVSLDAAGGFLVADAREAQVRRYAEDGRLVWSAGRKGSGPGEFRALARAIRLPSGEVLALESNGRATLYGPDGGAPVDASDTPFSNVDDVVPLGDSLLLVSALGRETGVMGPRLHVWDPRSREVRASFFEPMAGTVNPAAATIATWAKAAVRGDTIAAVFALGDTVYFFNHAGASTGALPLSAGGYRRVSRETPPPTSDIRRIAQWLSTFDHVSALHWLPDGRFVVVYQSVAPVEAMTRTAHLFVMDRAGNARAEVHDVPRLLAADPRSGRLYFVAEGHETPNRWAVATLRP